jgi:hypothetical protein
MSESDSWKVLRGTLIKEAANKKKAIHVDRIENLVGEGTFDTNICWAGNEFWLEGKYLKEFPVMNKTKVKIGLRPSQEVWATRRLLVEGKIFIWLHVGAPGCNRGKGWYLIKLDSSELINQCRYGMEQELLKTFRFDNADSLVYTLFDSFKTKT